MIHTHPKFTPLEFINKKMKEKPRFFTQTEHPLLPAIMGYNYGGPGAQSIKFYWHGGQSIKFYLQLLSKITEGLVHNQ